MRSLNGIEHVIVLMLENRSFDHMLGYLDHPDPSVGTLRDQPQSCPKDSRRPKAKRVKTTPTADHKLGVDPAHSHRQVLLQMFGHAPRTDPAMMNGFIESYRSRIRPGPQWPLKAQDTDIMHCFRPSELPVLATLAKEYAVFTKWFASVPGETWPNRNFAHAGTSDGTVNIVKRFYDNDTVFNRLIEAGQSWGVFHDGIPQVWVFQRLWRHSREPFKPISKLITAIKADELPAYSFVEPDHGFGLGEGNSQHPSNNRYSGKSFEGGERLIGAIYNALFSNPDVFDKTLFIVTYDEHGGFYDHVPPCRVVAPDKRREGTTFKFELSGVRVPAVAINPRIAAGTVVSTPLEHSSIAKTVRMLFAPDTDQLSAREADAPDLLDVIAFADTRRDDCQPLVLTPAPRGLAPQAPQGINDFESSLLDLAAAVRHILFDRGFVATPERDAPFLTIGAIGEAAASGTITPGSPAAVEIHDLISGFHDDVDA